MTQAELESVIHMAGALAGCAYMLDVDALEEAARENHLTGDNKQILQATAEYRRKLAALDWKMTGEK